MNARRKVARRLTPPPSVRMRKGVVLAVNANGTCDVQLSDSSRTLVLPHLDSCRPAVDDVVLILSDGQGGMVVADRYAGSVPAYTRGITTGTTDSSAYLTWTHGLGVVPASIVVTPRAPISGSPILGQLVCDSYTSTQARVRGFTPTGSGFNSASMTFSWAAYR